MSLYSASRCYIARWRQRGQPLSPQGARGHYGTDYYVTAAAGNSGEEVPLWGGEGGRVVHVMTLKENFGFSSCSRTSVFKSQSNLSPTPKYA